MSSAVLVHTNGFVASTARKYGGTVANVFAQIDRVVDNPRCAVPG